MRGNLNSGLPKAGCVRRNVAAAVGAICLVWILLAQLVEQRAAAAEPAARQTAADAIGLMYWTHGSQGIFRAARDGSEVTLLVAMTRVDGLAVDAEGGKLYFTKSAAPELNGDKLFRANLDGTEVTELAAGLNYTGDLVFDPQAKKLYVSSLLGRKILALNTDGTDMKDFVTGLINPDELALDLEGRFLYWSHSGPGGPIQRAKLGDGSDLKDVVNSRVRRFGMAIDVAEGQIYWVDANRGTIVRTGPDGKGETQIVGGRVGLDGLALDTDNQKIYWTETGKICQANLDGSGIEVLVPDKTDEFATLVILPPKE
jgi:sugar lactone lactonase YvrE